MAGSQLDRLCHGVHDPLGDSHGGRDVGDPVVCSVWELDAAGEEATRVSLTVASEPKLATDRLLELVAGRGWARRRFGRGLRRLRSILEGILLDTMFDLPSMDGVDEVHVDKEVVMGTKEPVRVYAKKGKAGDAA